MVIETKRRVRQFLLLALLPAVVTGCASAPSQQQASYEPPVQARSTLPTPDPARFILAKRFMNSIGAGDIAMNALKQYLDTQAKEQPGMVELFKRAASDLTPETFVDIAARSYARHLEEQHLAALTRFTESPTGARFFKVVIANVTAGAAARPMEELFRDFNADELTEILRFSQSEAAAAWQAQLPVINAEMSEESKRFGEQLMVRYISNK